MYITDKSNTKSNRISRIGKSSMNNTFYRSTFIGFSLILALWCESYGQDADDKEGEVVIVATAPAAEIPTETTTGEVVIVATAPAAETPTETTTGEVVIVATAPAAETDGTDSLDPRKEVILSEVLIVATVQVGDSAIHSTSWGSIKRSIGDFSNESLTINLEDRK